MKKIVITQDCQTIKTRYEDTEEERGIDTYSLISILFTVLCAFPLEYTEAVMKSMSEELQKAEESCQKN